MNSKESDIHLLAGDLVVITKAKGVISTLLGSCVSIIFHVPDRLTMACHALLPESRSTKQICGVNCPKPCGDLRKTLSEFRFVSCSLKYMVNELQSRHIHPSQVHVSLIGGANVLDINSDITIGTQNIKIAKEILLSNGFTIRREHTGGMNGCNVQFYPETNSLMIRVHGGGKLFELGDNYVPVINSLPSTKEDNFKRLSEELDKMRKHFTK